MAPEEPKKPLSATEARQGVRGTHLFRVLAIALLLAALAWAGLEIWGRYMAPDKPDNQTPSASTSAGAPQGGTVDNNPSPGQPVQPAPADRSENNQQGIKSTPAQPNRDGTQN